MSVLRISGMGAGLYVLESREEIVKKTDEAFATGARTIHFTLADKEGNESGTVVVATAAAAALAVWDGPRGVHMDGEDPDADD